MFELSDEEDQHFWEALPFDDSESIPSATTNIRLRLPHKEKEKPVTRKGFVADRQQQSTPTVKDGAKRKASKRRFPGPAGNLPLNMPKDMSPEFIIASPSLGPAEVLRNTETEKPDASQACLEEAFSSKQWKQLMSDLGPDASSVLAKFNLKSMLFKADKRMLPRGKIPLILGYIERVDCQGTDGSIVLRDPSGKMTGSIHHKLIRDPNTALQVGWVLVLRQVSVISPMRNHYLNITSGNIVAIYRLDKDDEVAMTSWPCNGSASLSSHHSSTSTSDKALSWEKLIKESENELTIVNTPRNHTTNIIPKTPTSTSAFSLGKSTLVLGKVGVSGRAHPPSSLFTGFGSHQTCNPQPDNRYDSGYGKNFSSPVSLRASVDVVNDEFPDDDSDMLSFCDMGAFDEPCSSVAKSELGRCDSKAACENASHHSSPPIHINAKPLHGLISSSRLNPSVVPRTPNTHTTNNSPSNFGPVKKKEFSFKLTSSTSSPNNQLQILSGMVQETGGFLEPKEKSPTSSTLSVEEQDLNTRSNAGRDLKVQLIANAIDTKENQNQFNDMFGQWNDDLSDEMLSQLSEEF